jgi:hypothetical protein
MMSNNKIFFTLFALMLLGSLVVSCTEQTSPATAVESYLDAIVAKDVVAATNLSCLAWEEDAYAEASSFETVDVRLEGVSCEVISSGEEYQRVTCDGEIIANYGGEDQDIPLASREFYVIEEGGEWRMCGYSAP